MGMIHWGKKTLADFKQSSYYDHSFYIVPVSGTIDIHKISNVLRKAYFPPAFNNFGGYCTLGDVKDLGDGNINVEVVYHIGE